MKVSELSPPGSVFVVPTFIKNSNNVGFSLPTLYSTSNYELLLQTLLLLFKTSRTQLTNKLTKDTLKKRQDVFDKNQYLQVYYHYNSRQEGRRPGRSRRNITLQGGYSLLINPSHAIGPTTLPSQLVPCQAEVLVGSLELFPQHPILVRQVKGWRGGAGP